MAAPLRDIKNVQFGIISPEECKRMSVCKIDKAETFNYETKLAVEGGLYDVRLGAPASFGMLCGSCQQRC